MLQVSWLSNWLSAHIKGVLYKEGRRHCCKVAIFLRWYIDDVLWFFFHPQESLLNFSYLQYMNIISKYHKFLGFTFFQRMRKNIHQILCIGTLPLFSGCQDFLQPNTQWLMHMWLKSKFCNPVCGQGSGASSRRDKTWDKAHTKALLLEKISTVLPEHNITHTNELFYCIVVYTLCVIYSIAELGLRDELWLCTESQTRRNFLKSSLTVLTIPVRATTVEMWLRVTSYAEQQEKKNPNWTTSHVVCSLSPVNVFVA